MDSTISAGREETRRRRMMEFTDYILTTLVRDNDLRPIYETSSIIELTDICDYLLSVPDNNMSQYDQLLMTHVIDICNIVYNNTDRDVLPVEDGVYDLLMAKYTKNVKDYHIGAEPIIFKNKETSDIAIEKQRTLMTVITPEQEDTISNMFFPDIIPNKKHFTRNDLLYMPMESTGHQNISKRIHNTKHEHPELVGTLDKCKYVLNNDAIQKGVFNDANVRVLERDFFEPLFKRGIMNMNEEYVMIAELKYDGISVEADIENGQIVSARTRGDTANEKASDLTPIFEGYIFPDAYDINIESFGIKFEAIITNDDLERLNKLRGTSYINCRTAIIGLIGSSDARLYREFITLIPLATTIKDEDGEPLDRLVEIEFMNKYFCRSQLLRFEVITGNFVNLMFQINKFVQEAEFARDFIPFMYDGVVLSFYDPKLRKLLGRENYVNKYSVAIKFNAMKKNTIFLGYTFEIGQNGVITPMLHYQPVEFMGAIHTKSSANSLDRFNKLGLREGDIISVEYVNDVIPYATKPDIEVNRNNQNPVIPFPDKCPCCGTPLKISETGKSAYCPNMNCKERSYRRMSNMLSKLGIKDFSYESVKTLDVTSLRQLYKLSNKEFMILGPNEGMNLKRQIMELKEKPLYDYQIIGALGFSNIAIKTFQLIFEIFDLENFMFAFDAKEYGKMAKEYSISGDNIEYICLCLFHSEIKGIGVKTVETISNEYPHFKNDIKFIDKNFNVQKYSEANHNIKKIVMTGFRDQNLSKVLNDLGYDANSNNTLTKDSALLIIPTENHQSSKVTKAQKYGVKIMDVQTVWNLINTNEIQNVI